MSADLPHEHSDTEQPLTPQQIEAFWSDFSSQLSELEALDGHEFVERANEVLQQYAPGLSLELEGKLKEHGVKTEHRVSRQECVAPNA